MTFQIGMVAEDGVLLASDLLGTQGSQYYSQIRTTQRTPKIEFDVTRELAYCWAGDELGRVTVQAIVGKWDGSHRQNLKSFLLRRASEAITRARAICASNSTSAVNNCCVLIVFRNPPDSVSLWRVELSTVPNSCPVVDQILDKTVTGDQGQSSRVLHGEVLYQRSHSGTANPLGIAHRSNGC